MAIPTTAIRVLVASPSDVEEEREALEQVVDELNLTWADTLGLQIELLSWRTHAVPGIGQDPQQVINRQLGDGFDIFLGIMWARFGTPTPRAASGTQEEFKRALARYRQNPGSIDLMLYFKDSPLSPSQIDVEQLAEVRKFKEQLGPEGILYWTFRDPEEFQSLARIHLSRKVQSWRNRLAHLDASPSPMTGDADGGKSALANVESEEISEVGLIELTLSYEEAFTDLEQIALRMAQDIHSLGARLDERTMEIKAIGASATPTQRRQAAARIFKRTAEDMLQYVERTRVELPPFSTALRRGIDAYGKALTITSEAGPSAVSQIRESLSQIAALREAIAGASAGASGMKASVAGVPRLSADMIAAKKKTVAALGDIIEELHSADRLLSEVADSMRDWLVGQAS